MKDFITVNEWKVIEDGFHPEYQLNSESLFSLGNGLMGQRGNFEEFYSGKTLLGNYVAGVYYPDKTRVGWWKNGYPEYYAKVLNATNWIKIDLKIDGETVDLGRCKEIHSFQRILHMDKGYLERSVTLTLHSGKMIEIKALRFISIVDTEVSAIKYSVTLKNFSGKVTFSPMIDGDVHNEDANYGEKFWEEVQSAPTDGLGHDYLVLRTKKLDFWLATGMRCDLLKNSKPLSSEERSTVLQSQKQLSKDKCIGHELSIDAQKEETITLIKYVATLSSRYHNKEEMMKKGHEVLELAYQKGFEKLLSEQESGWKNRWEMSDIRIVGDAKAQQGIRFNLFHLFQTYTGEDERLNIGPKGFTGEKYGGSTYWDTEAYCLPLYLKILKPAVAEKLLMYRYRHLQKAIENASKLGFKGGAALYPMVTMNGEECHNEWEITFEEIHRNGAIAYAIYLYTNYTGDTNYLYEYGIHVLVAISRFWAQRVHYVQAKDCYMIHGVTGPNEYENNVNNNWYTNKLAAWTLEYTLKILNEMKTKQGEKYQQLILKLKLKEIEELKNWSEIREKIYFPYDPKLSIFLQQDGYLDKELLDVSALSKEDTPLCQKWSWDRILRSCFIKQADVLQGLYFFFDEYDVETVRRNFDFYEPKTVHESSLSPCIHSILATKLGKIEKAYEMYLRTSRLDLDDINNDTLDGLHITSMAGTVLTLLEGFGGMSVKGGDNHPTFSPSLPKEWQELAFRLFYHNLHLEVIVNENLVKVKNLSSGQGTVAIYDQVFHVGPHEEVQAKI